MGCTLEYASTSAQVRRHDGEDVLLSFPLFRSRLGFVAHFSLFIGLIVMLLVCAALPGGGSVVIGMSSTTPEGGGHRVFTVALAVFTAWCLRCDWRTRHRHVEIRLRGHTLRCVQPHWRKDEDSTYDLRRFRRADAYVEENSSGLALRGAERCDDVKVFDVPGNRWREFEPAAALINESIAGA